jgi:predicted RNA-binding protein
MADLRTLYDEDFVAWTEQQAEALRSASRGSTNQPVDWENLAEEIESLGKSDRRELRSQIYRVVRHLAKLQFSAAAEPRDGWRDSVTDGRKRAELILADSPSLKSQLDQFVSEEGAAAVERAVADLDEFGELNRQTELALRSTRYTIDQILGNWFPTAPQRSAGRGKRGR